MAHRARADRGVLRRRDGARDAHRTVFAVGDRKQSIYSFQGADVDAFDRSHRLLRERVERGGQALAGRARWTCRSVRPRPVLELVDRVFADPTAAAGVVDAGDTLHALRRPGGPCRRGGVVAARAAARCGRAAALDGAGQNRGLTSAPQVLAETLARWIAREVGGGGDAGEQGAAACPRRRDGAGAAAQRLRPRPGARAEVAGRAGGRAGPADADRAAGGAGPDGARRCAAAAAGRPDLRLPADQPARRTVGRQPADLAIGRSGAVVGDAARAGRASGRTGRRPGRSSRRLLARVDYVSPHALFAEALGPLGGRARLFARLGPEAAEPVDELLNAALAYGRMHPPSLQGFLHWLRRSGAEVKREAEGAGSLVRVMTVHGAKGLQAPLVILPDTTSLPPDEGSILWATDPATGRDVPIWSPRREVRCAAAQRLRDAAKQRRMEEHNRLLYVALTRAEDRLLVCGWQTRRGLDDACWYRLVERGFDALPAERRDVRRLGRRTATPRHAADREA